MLGDVLVVDATIHGFNFHPDNYRADFLPDLMQMLYTGATTVLTPPDQPEYLVSWEEFIGMFAHQPDLTGQVMFRESCTDVAVYHGVPLFGMYADGSSPLWVARAAREVAPHRIPVYGPLYPWRDDALDELDRMVAEDGISGVKFYPLDIEGTRFRPSRMDDERTFAVVARARELGLRMVGIHKAVPLGPMPLEPYFAVDDCAPLVAAFPDMTFEIVHGGIAFLDETVRLVERHPNVAINLEGTAGYAIRLVDQFVEIMSAFLRAGAADRIFYASGALGMHPQPTLQRFWEFEMPPGHPELTEQHKRDILGLNYARHAGWDVDALTETLRTDHYGLRTGPADLDAPWTLLKAARR